MREKFYGKTMQGFVAGVIIVNAITIGMETFPAVISSMGSILNFINSVILAIFTVEVLCRFYFERSKFFSNGWNWFDAIIVLTGYMPDGGMFTIFRLTRILRVFRLFSVVPELRVMVEALLQSIPSLGWVGVFSMTVSYIFAIIGIHLYGQDFPEYFGTLPKSIYTMFEMLTLAGWHIIARMVAEKHSHFYLFFIPYVLGASYIVLNMAMGVLINSMRSAQLVVVEKERQIQQAEEAKMHEVLLRELADINEHLERLESRANRGA